MVTKPIYTIVGICPDTVHNKIIKFKTELGVYKPDSPVNKQNIILKDTAHFAIKRSFWLAEGISEWDLLARLGTLTFNKCQISSSRLEKFSSSPYGMILFAEINKGKGLLELHLKLKSLLDDFIVSKNPEYENEGFVPHISLAYDIPLEKLEFAESQLGEKLFPIEFELDRIFLLKGVDHQTDEREILKVYKSIY